MTKQECVCFFKGHRADDEGYCDRCGKDYNDWINTIRDYLNSTYYNIRHKIVRNLYWKCSSCNKLERLLGKDVNDHSNCLPF